MRSENGLFDVRVGDPDEDELDLYRKVCRRRWQGRGREVLTWKNPVGAMRKTKRHTIARKREAEQTKEQMTKTTSKDQATRT